MSILQKIARLPMLFRLTLPMCAVSSTGKGPPFRTCQSCLPQLMRKTDPQFAESRLWLKFPETAFCIQGNGPNIGAILRNIISVEGDDGKVCLIFLLKPAINFFFQIRIFSCFSTWDHYIKN